MQESFSYKFFCNTDCQYFPCHEEANTERFNCLFCFCPLYKLGDKCGGKFTYTTNRQRIKNCVNCDLPHDPAYYDSIIKKLREEIASASGE